MMIIITPQASPRAVPPRDRWGQQRLACRQIQAEGGKKKEKENAIKGKTLSKQASAKIQEGGGGSMRGAKEEAEQKNANSKRRKMRKQEMKNKD